MKNLIAFIFLILSYQSASAEAIDPAAYMIKLVDFSLDAREAINRKIWCSASEVKLGVINHITFDPTVDNAWRDLRPTDYPLSNKASWKLADRSCVNDWYNGIGFDSYDSASGKAAIFIANYRRVPVVESDWNKSDSLGRMILMFEPKFNLQDKILFSAKCELKNDSPFGYFGFGEVTGVCRFAAGGEMNFMLKKKGR